MKSFFTLLFAVILLYAIHGLLSTPRLDRNWALDQQKLAEVEFNGDFVTIKDIRNIFYRSTDDFDLSFYDKTIKLNDIQSAWYLVEPFGQFGAAHTLVSFGFKDGSYIAVSAEIRREKGESFNALKGVFRQYELVYIIADESDVIKLRTNHRKNEVRLYPIRASKKTMRLLFVDMLKRAQKLAETPEFYNTITNNCTTNIVHHVRKFSDRDIPWFDLRYVMPEHSDKVAYNAGILKTDLPLYEARQFHSITRKAQNCTEPERFSACIRRYVRPTGTDFAPE